MSEDKRPSLDDLQRKIQEAEAHKLANMTPEHRALYLRMKLRLRLGKVGRPAERVVIGRSGRHWKSSHKCSTQATAPEQTKPQRLMICLQMDTGGTPLSERLEREDITYINAADGWHTEFLENPEPGQFTTYLNQVLTDIRDGKRAPLSAVGLWIGAHGTNQPMHLFELSSGKLESTSAYIQQLLDLHLPFTLITLSTCHAGAADKVSLMEGTGGIMFGSSKEKLANGYAYKEETIDGTRVYHYYMSLERSGYHMRYSVDCIEFEAALLNYDSLAELWSRCNAVFSFHEASCYFRWFTKGSKLPVCALSREEKQMLQMTGVDAWLIKFTPAGIVREKFHAEPRPTDMYKTLQEIPDYQNARRYRGRISSKSTSDPKKHSRSVDDAALEEDPCEVAPKRVKLDCYRDVLWLQHISRSIAIEKGLIAEDYDQDEEDVWPTPMSAARSSPAKPYDIPKSEKSSSAVEHFPFKEVPSFSEGFKFEPFDRSCSQIDAVSTKVQNLTVEDQFDYLPSALSLEPTTLDAKTSSANTALSIRTSFTNATLDTETSSTTSTPKTNGTLSGDASAGAVHVQPLRIKKRRGRQPRSVRAGDASASESESESETETVTTIPSFVLPDSFSDFKCFYSVTLVGCLGVQQFCPKKLLKGTNNAEMNIFSVTDWMKIARKYCS